MNSAILDDISQVSLLWDQLRKVPAKRMYGVCIQWCIETQKPLDHICKMIVGGLEYDKKEVLRSVPEETILLIQKLYKP